MKSLILIQAISRIQVQLTFNLNQNLINKLVLQAIISVTTILIITMFNKTQILLKTFKIIKGKV